MDGILQKINRLNSVFRESATTFTPLAALSDKLCNIIGCNIYLFDTEGHIFAYSVAQEFICEYSAFSLADRTLPEYYRKLFVENDAPVLNCYEKAPACTYTGVKKCLFEDRYYALYPIYSNFKKVAGMLLIRYGVDFDESDYILCEYTSAIVSLEMLRQEQVRTEQRALEIAQAKLSTNFLTPSEISAVKTALEEIEYSQGNIFLNAVASKCYSTQSTVTSALKKMESAGVITTKSQGVKGKYVKVLNRFLKSELAAVDHGSKPSACDKSGKV